jgi:plasmid stabilization system protein ParE
VSVAAERKLEELAYWLMELRHAEPSGDLSRQCATAVARSAELQESGELGRATELPDQLARLCVCLTDQHLAADLPVRWSRFVDALTHADGPQLHLDLDAAVLQVGDLQVQLDHLMSAPDSWRLYLRAKPTWWGYSTDGHRKWELLSVRADDDQGGRYVPTFGGSSGERGHEELMLNFIPRIDPLARRLRLMFSGEAEEAEAEFDIASATA